MRFSSPKPQAFISLEEGWGVEYSLARGGHRAEGSVVGVPPDLSFYTQTPCHISEIHRDTFGQNNLDRLGAARLKFV